MDEQDQQTEQRSPQDATVEARLSGYSWGDIWDYLGKAANTALDFGYHQDEIDDHLGRAAPPDLTSTVQAAAQTPDADTHADLRDQLAGKNPPLVPDDVRDAYAMALQGNSVQTPEEFSGAWADATDTVHGPHRDTDAAASALAAQLPSKEEFTDHAIATVAASGQPLSVPLVRLTQDNLVEHYALTGETPQAALQRAKTDPDFADQITSPQPVAKHQRIDEMLTAPVWNWLNSKPDMANADRTAKAFTSAFENLDMGTKEYVGGVLGEVLGDTVAAAKFPFAVLQGTLQGLIASTAGNLGDVANFTEADKDRTMRDALALLMSFGADAPNVAKVGKAPPIAETLEHFQTGIHPEAAKIIAEHAGDILTPVEGDSIPVYHGTPYDFEKFETEKIGTGEGNTQETRWGLFTAQREGTAKFYQDYLTGGRLEYEGDLTAIQREAFDEVNEFRGRGETFEETQRKAVDDAKGTLDQLEPGSPEWTEQKGWVDALSSIDPSKVKAAGHLYEASVQGKLDHFLDWNADFREQSPYVQQRVQQLLDPEGTGEHAGRPLVDLTGEEIHALLGQGKTAADKLSEVGIPGIRYHDRVTRNAQAEINALGNKQVNLENAIKDLKSREEPPADLITQRENELENIKQQHAIAKANFDPTYNLVVHDANKLKITAKDGKAAEAHMAGELAGAAVQKSFLDNLRDVMGPAEPPTPGTEILYHGSKADTINLREGRLHLTPEQENAGWFGRNIHELEAKPGKTKDLGDIAAYMEEVGKDDLQSIRDEGYRYVTFKHPAGMGNETFPTKVALYPKEDLTVRPKVPTGTLGPAITGALKDQGGALNLNAFTRWLTPAEFSAKVTERADKEMAKAAIQALTGRSYRENQAGWKQLEEHFKTVEKWVPEYRTEIAGIRAAGGDILYRYDPFTGQMRDRSMLGQLDDYMDSRYGVQAPAPDHPLFPIIQALRESSGIMRAEIERRGPDAIKNFVQWYMPRLYKNEARFAGDFVGKQGSRANTERRSIPTHTEAIERGHEPRYLNPLERQMHYNQAMRAFLDQDNMLRQGIAAGRVYYASAPRQDGDVALKGRGAERIIDKGMTTAQAKDTMAAVDNRNLPYGATLDAIKENAQNGTIVQRAYASKGWGTIYNRYYDQGFGRYGDWRSSLYEKMLFASNASVAAKLGLSLYHVGDIIQEAYSTALSRALNAAGRGEMPSVQMFLDLIGAPVTYYKRGKQAQDIYLQSPTEREWANMNGGANATYQEKIARILSSAGVRPVGRTQEYMVGHQTNLWQAIARGTYLRELKEGVDWVKEGAGPGAPLIRQGATITGRAAAEVLIEGGRILNSFMTPVFDKMVPRIKYGATVSELHDWLQRNPGASEEAATAYARKLINSMDDRFGELVQDNLHWNKMIRQTLNVMTVSVGWEYGTLRAFGGILNRDPEKRWMAARWLAGFSGATAAANAIYQYLKTGKGPESFLDLLAPQNGALTPEGKPARSLLPGYQKDPIQWWVHLAHARDPVQFMNGLAEVAGHKLNNWMDVLAGWYGSPDFQHYFSKVVSDYVPLNFQNAGRGISKLEQYLGLAREASNKIEDPERAASQREKARLYDLMKEKAMERGANRRLETPDAAVEAETTKSLSEIAKQLRELSGQSGGGTGRSRSSQDYNRTSFNEYARRAREANPDFAAGPMGSGGGGRSRGGTSGRANVLRGGGGSRAVPFPSGGGTSGSVNRAITRSYPFGARTGRTLYVRRARR